MLLGIKRVNSCGLVGIENAKLVWVGPWASQNFFPELHES